MKKAFPIIAIALLICIAIISQIHKRKKGKMQYKQFYTSSIHGIIQDVTASAGTTYFSINGKRYGFWPRRILTNKDYRFSIFAKHGDSISKPAYSDTLKLIKKNKKYLFTFKKFK